MTERLLSLAVLLGSGVTAGVLFAVALSVVPAMRAMPPQTYVYVHQLLGRNWDPTMPLVVLGSTVLDLALVLLAPSGLATALFGIAAVLLLGTSVVSHFCNVPINRTVKSLDPDQPIPERWRDPRPLWRRWHLVRTTLSITALAVNAIAVTLL